MVSNRLLSLNQENKPVYVRSLFNKIAPIYDLLNDIMSLGLHKGWKKQAIQSLGIKNGNNVLDLCCGSGDISALILSDFTDDVVINAVDFSDEMLSIAKAKHGSFSNIIFTQADALSLPFEDHSFDNVIISFGLRNLASIESGYKEIYRVLKPGGCFVNLDFGKPSFFLINIIFNVYFSFFVPILAKIFNNYSEYVYLSDSIKLFPAPGRLVVMMQEAGFVKVFNKSLFSGFVAFQTGYKT
ncbi:MAG: bifunctional demethylmenaquinone methyltransferase/2-methoxy-6-polyprenyl-1,4-benzoquinol methylase UbiE [Vampirovibrionia bacterium]